MHLKGVKWNALVNEEFLRLATLTEEEKVILHYRVTERPNSWIADKVGISLKTLDRRIDSLLSKYEDARKINPNLPKPYKSKKELWMDTH